MLSIKDLVYIEENINYADLIHILSNILKLNSYQNRGNDFFEFSKKDKEKLGADNVNKLLKYKILLGNTLQLKIDEFLGRIFITDENLTKSSVRVHPYKDESIDLYGYIKKHRIDSWASVLIDPACGCGHHGLNFSKSINKIFSFDINKRSLIISKINSKLYKVKNIKYIENDICENFPNIKLSNDDKILITVNMPFGMFPYRYNSLSLSQDGKEDDASYLSICALKKIKEFLGPYKNYRIIFLFCSVGNLKKDKWKVLESTRKAFNKCKISNTIISGKKLLRINGKKREENPMNIEKLIRKSDCLITFSDKERNEVKKYYKELATKLFNRGDTHLLYGLIDIESRYEK